MTVAPEVGRPNPPLTLMDRRMIASMVSLMARELGPSLDPARTTADFIRAMEIDLRFRRQIRELAKRLPAGQPTPLERLSATPLALAPPATPIPPLMLDRERPVCSVELDQKVKLADWLVIAAPALLTMLVLGLGPLSIMLR